MPQPDKLPLSVIVLTPTKEKLSPYQKTQLDRAVASASFADEVLVINHNEPIIDFAQARNGALRQAKHEWVFFLDSDEWIETGSESAVEALLAEQLAGIAVRRMDVFHHQVLKFGETGQHYLLRLMRRNQSTFTRPVHERAVVQGTTRTTEITLWHESHQDISQFWQSITRYAELEAEWRVTQNPEPDKLKIILQLLIFPFAKFWLNYVGKLGLLDGWSGLVYAAMMSCHSLLVRIFWLEKIIAISKK